MTGCEPGARAAAGESVGRSAASRARVRAPWESGLVAARAEPAGDFGALPRAEAESEEESKGAERGGGGPSAPSFLPPECPAGPPPLPVGAGSRSYRSIMLAVYFDQPGDPSNLYLKEVAKPEPGAGEVLLKVAASALNRADVLQRRGLYRPPEGASSILGLEVSGHVAKIGPSCQGPWKEGQPAMALLAGGGQAEYAVVPEGYLMPIPKGLTLTQAAAIPEAWLTAFQLLHLIGQVKAGETVLIHAGSSGVGTAAVQLARLAGAIPLITAGAQDKIEAVKKLGAAAGFNYKEEDFSAATLEFTKGAGANVILDCVGGSYWEKNVACLAQDGRWVLYGLLGGAEVHGELLSKLLAKRGNLFTSLLRTRDKKYKAELVSAFTQQILPHFAQDEPGALRPVVDSVYPLKQVAEAHEYMEQNKNLGKIVLEVASGLGAQ